MNRRITLHTTISRREYAEVVAYQELDQYLTMESLIDFLLHNYIRHCRKEYADNQQTIQRQLDHMKK